MIDALKLEWLSNIELSSGSHASPRDGVCALEAAAYIAGEEHSDAPDCVCPVIASLLWRWNDDLLRENRTRLLRPLIPLIVGTRASHSVSTRRAYMALDWMVREAAPLCMDLVPSFAEHAVVLRALAPVGSLAAMEGAGGVVRALEVALGSQKIAGWLLPIEMGGVEAVAVAAHEIPRPSGVMSIVDAVVRLIDSVLKVAYDGGCDLVPGVVKLQESVVALVERMCEVR